MNTYEVDLERTVGQVATVTVAAENEEGAITRAYEVVEQDPEYWEIIGDTSDQGYEHVTMLHEGDDDE